MTFKIPILIVVYNRPDLLEKVLNSISKIKPLSLYVAFDGPKNIRDKSLCKKSLEILNKIDWNCKLITNVSNSNLGCKKRVSSAIDWFFEHETEGIILEDDTLPSKSFFYFCRTMLERYRKTKEVMHISGNNFLPIEWKCAGDYYFSRIPNVWGWATWKRAWEKYDVNMRDFPKFSESKEIYKTPFHLAGKKVLMNYFKRTYLNCIDTWDFQWTFSVIKNHGICINPSHNLVQNIGFSEAATHTTKQNLLLQRNAENLRLSKYVDEIKVDYDADKFILKQNFGATIPKYYLQKLKKIFDRIYYNLILFKQKL